MSSDYLPHSKFVTYIKLHNFKFHETPSLTPGYVQESKQVSETLFEELIGYSDDVTVVI